MEIPLTPNMKNVVVSAGAKRTMLRKEIASTETIAVGSSHGDFGFNPAYCPGAFNLCSRSQDLKYSFHLYQHVARSQPNLEQVVLFYSIFSPGFIWEQVPSENEMCPPLNEIFGLGLTYEDPRLDAISRAVAGKLDTLAVETPGVGGFIGNTTKTFFPETYGAERRAQDHLKYNRSCLSG
ncbi:hypothetical protein [Ferrovibrio xuzhouensis]|uniref:Uncharacterized protein n=1 Tax=Ferrovibrio xuzhouensis TaxID=1576914 RepID=A0ABV7VBZ8_9PROT